MSVDVTQEHIDKGMRDSCLSCPIALALKKKGDRLVRVRNTVAYVANMPYQLPQEAIAFILDFDHGELVKPFSFEMVNEYVKPTV